MHNPNTACFDAPVAPARARPQLFGHVVYRTRRFDAMLRWYRIVFGAEVVVRNPAMAFTTFDEEHHRFAFVDLDVVRPAAAPAEPRALVGIDHLAWTLPSLDALFDQYEALAAEGIVPYWCVHHGLTVSMYYADPDGNQMEFQVDSFPTKPEAVDYLRGPAMAANPIGVEFDPADWLRRLRAGTPAQRLLQREVHSPVSPIRGSFERAD